MDVKSVLITGTTSGLGRGLLEHYAESEVKVISVNRRRVAELEARYPSVRFECLDVRSTKDVEDLVRGLAAAGELPDVFILNAGINRLDNDETFDLGLYREVLDTNLYGVLNFIGPLIDLSADPVERHIVAISSTVTYAGSPYGLGYQTSKQALTTCFDVWSQMYRGTDLVFQQVILGARSHLDLYPGRKAARLDVADQAPFFRIAERRGPRHLELCADPQEEAVPSMAGLRRVRYIPAGTTARSRLLPRAEDAGRKTTSQVRRGPALIRRSGERAAREQDAEGGPLPSLPGFISLRGG